MTEHEDPKKATGKPRRRRRHQVPEGQHRDRIQQGLDRRADELAEAFRRSRGRA